MGDGWFKGYDERTDEPARGCGMSLLPIAAVAVVAVLVAIRLLGS